MTYESKHAAPDAPVVTETAVIKTAGTRDEAKARKEQRERQAALRTHQQAVQDKLAEMSKTGPTWVPLPPLTVADLLKAEVTELIETPAGTFAVLSLLSPADTEAAVLLGKVLWRAEVEAARRGLYHWPEAAPRPEPLHVAPDDSEAEREKLKQQAAEAEKAGQKRQPLTGRGFVPTVVGTDGATPETAWDPRGRDKGGAAGDQT